MARIAVIYNPETSPHDERFLPSMRLSADALGVEVTVARVRDVAAIEQAVGSIAKAGDAGLIFPLILIRTAIRMSGSFRPQHSTACRRFTAFEGSHSAAAS